MSLPDVEPQVPAADPVLVPVGSWAGAVAMCQRQSQAGFFVLLSHECGAAHEGFAWAGQRSVSDVRAT